MQVIGSQTSQTMSQVGGFNDASTMTFLQAERDAFADFDSENFVRQKMVEALHKRFPENKLNFAIGGQISIDVFPQVRF